MFGSFFRSTTGGRMASQARRSRDTAAILCFTLVAGIANATDGSSKSIKPVRSRVSPLAMHLASP